MMWESARKRSRKQKRESLTFVGLWWLGHSAPQASRARCITARLRLGLQGLVGGGTCLWRSIEWVYFLKFACSDIYGEFWSAEHIRPLQIKNLFLITTRVTNIGRNEKSCFFFRFQWFFCTQFALFSFIISKFFNRLGGKLPKPPFRPGQLYVYR